MTFPIEDPDASPTEEDCWAAFWEIIGREAYRIWREEQAGSSSDGTASL